MLKCQFHSHSTGDPVDHIPHTPKELIDEAKKLKYDILTITCHRKLIYSEELKKYAEDKGITLIPGIEFEINKKHILGINIDKEIELINSFEKLREYKKTHPDCLIIAPHPFFPGSTTLKNDLINNKNLFDGVEISFCYTKLKDYNKKAIKFAKENNIPLIATGDCHSLRDLNSGHCLVKGEKNVKSIIDAIKMGKIENKTSPTTLTNIGRFIIVQNLRNIFKKKWRVQ